MKSEKKLEKNIERGGGILDSKRQKMREDIEKVEKGVMGLGNHSSEKKQDGWSWMLEGIGVVGDSILYSNTS